MALFKEIRLTNAADEMLFGEIVRLFVTQKYPLLKQHSGDDDHVGTFLMAGTDFFTMTVEVHRFTKSFAMSKLVDTPMRIDLKGQAIVKGATFNKLAEMYQTNLNNVMKFPLLGMIKIYHDYNRIYVYATLAHQSRRYFSDREHVDKEALAVDIENAIGEMLGALQQFQGKNGSGIFVDQAFDVEGEIKKREQEIITEIEQLETIIVNCPECGTAFDAPKKGMIKCPSCGIEGELDL